MRRDHTRAHLVQAALEGVVFALRDGVEVFREQGIAQGEVRAVGGGAQALWRQIQRAGYNRPIRRWFAIAQHRIAARVAVTHSRAPCHHGLIGFLGAILPGLLKGGAILLGTLYSSRPPQGRWQASLPTSRHLPC